MGLRRSGLRHFHLRVCSPGHRLRVEGGTASSSSCVEQGALHGSEEAGGMVRGEKGQTRGFLLILLCVPSELGCLSGRPAERSQPRSSPGAGTLTGSPAALVAGRLHTPSPRLLPGPGRLRQGPLPRGCPTYLSPLATKATSILFYLSPNSQETGQAAARSPTLSGASEA